MCAMTIHALSIDWRLDHPDIRREEFFALASLSSYSAVFIDPESISRSWTFDIAPGGDGARRTDPLQDRGLGRTLSAWMTRRRTEAEDLLKRGGGLLVCRMRPRGEPLLIAGEAPEERIDRYSWLPSVALVDRHHQFAFPANGRFVPRRGEDVVVEETDSPFAGYLRRFEGRIAYSAVYQDLLSAPIDHFATILARNRVGDVVALEIPFDEGRLVLLPPVEGASPAQEAEALLEAAEAAAARPGFFATPDWLPSYLVPGEEDLINELAGLEERLATLAAKIEEVSGKLSETSRFNRILYTRGRFSYLPAVADSMHALGFEVDAGSDVLRLRSEEGDALVVAAAAEANAVGLPPYRDLLKAIDRAVTEGDGHHKGILVVSGSRELDPKRRPTQFSPEVLRGCQAQGFCLISSYALFKLVQKSLADRKADLAPLRRAILECDGEFRASDSA